MAPLGEHSYRAERVADLIRQELALLLKREAKDPRLGFVTITRIKVTRDMRTARVAVSVLGDDRQKKDSLAGLGAAQGFLRRELAHRLGMRHTPALEFHIDDGVESEERIEQLLRQLREKS